MSPALLETHTTHCSLLRQFCSLTENFKYLQQNELKNHISDIFFFFFFFSAAAV